MAELGRGGGQGVTFETTKCVRSEPHPPEEKQRYFEELRFETARRSEKIGDFVPVSRCSVL
jgi:hypothetical protein